VAALVAEPSTLGYNPNQARIPAGQHGGGRWTRTPGALGTGLGGALEGYLPSSVAEGVDPETGDWEDPLGPTRRSGPPVQSIDTYMQEQIDASGKEVSELTPGELQRMKRTALRQHRKELAEYDRWVEDNRSKITEEFYAGRTKGSEPDYAPAVLNRTNPNYGQGPAYEVNCQNTVTAFDMQMRGYDVAAEPRYEQGPESWFDNRAEDRWPGNYPTGVRLSGAHDSSTRVYEDFTFGINRVMADNPGEPKGKYAWGFAQVDWLSGGGHVFSWTKSKSGVLLFLDPQTGETYGPDNPMWKRIKKAALYRTDDKPDPFGEGVVWNDTGTARYSASVRAGALALLVAALPMRRTLVPTFGYNPSQARIPAGNPGGGRWTITPGSLGRSLGRLLPGQKIGTDIDVGQVRTEAADAILAKEGLPDVDTYAGQLMSIYDGTPEEYREAGHEWYDEANGLMTELSEQSGYTPEQCAAVISHLSPRTSWDRNVEGARELILNGQKADGLLNSNYERAKASLELDDPMSSFGPTAKKTESFAANIFGDPDAVTVDVWALRALGLTDDVLKGGPKRKAQIYEALSQTYREAAKRAGITPREMQAIIWVQVRDNPEYLAAAAPPPLVDDSSEIDYYEAQRAKLLQAPPSRTASVLWVRSDTYGYNPNQARIPAGNPGGGRWTRTPGALGAGLAGMLPTGGDVDLPENLAAGTQIPDYVRGKSPTGEYGPEYAEAAQRVYDQAVAAEPQITADVVDLLDANGGEPNGLEYRVKTPDSIEGKIFREQRDGGGTVDEVAGKLSDLNRYTGLWDDQTYAQGAQSVVDELRAKGYDVRVKNYWGHPENPYRGINLALVSPDGQKLELQFHTPDSFDLKMDQAAGSMHDLYRRWQQSTDPSERAELNARMHELSRTLNEPPGVRDVA
jgi:hypothetical protein